MEHTPWIGDRYQQGINGQRFAIIGYSHHHDSEDYAEMTEDCINNVIYKRGGFEDIMFFRHIQSYFGFDDGPDFLEPGDVLQFCANIDRG